MVVTTAENNDIFTEARPDSPKIALIGVLLSFAFSGNVTAAEWKIVPSFGLAETHTDNVRLQGKDKEEVANVTQATPGISINATGQRLNLHVNYVVQNYTYSGTTRETKHDHLLQADANFALVKNLFFLEGKSSITKQSPSPFGPVTEGSFNFSDNQTKVKTTTASPYFRRNFSDDFTGEMRYSRDSVSSDNVAINNIDGNSDAFHFSLNSGVSFQRIKWGLNYHREKIQFEKQAQLAADSTKFNLNYYISPLFGLTSTVGKESNSYVSLGEKPPGSFWMLGFAWMPTQRTNFYVSGGERFFGKTYALTINQRARMSVWSLGYNEEITTTRGQFLLPATDNTSAFLNQLWQTTIPDATSRQKTVDGFIRDTGLPAELAKPINTFTNQVFLQRSLQGSVGITGVRNTLVFNVFNNLREPLSTTNVDALLNPTALNKVRQTGVNGLWNIQFSPRTNASLSAAFNRAETIEASLVDKTKTLRASISRQLQSKLKATFELRRVQRNSTLVTGNYEENAATLNLLLGF